MSYNSVFLEEMEVLQAIYEDELIISESNHRSAEIKITIHPNTADDEDGKYVCLTLHFCFTFSPKSTHCYPNKEPSIFIKNPRGLSDSHLASIEENLKSLAASMTGEQMLFSLIEYAKESLTDNNHPSCNCPICLEKFEEGGNFFRTACYHYFHRKCIKGYIEVAENLTCPVCRLEFQTDESILRYEEEEVHGETDVKHSFVPDETFLDWRRKCVLIYEKQRKNGGIIDPEFEKNKYLITLVDTPSMESNQLAASVYGADTANDTEINNTVFRNKGFDSPKLRSKAELPSYRGNSPELRSYRTNSPKPRFDKTSSPVPSNDGVGADSPLMKLKNIHIHEEKTENLPDGELLNGYTTDGMIPRDKKLYQSSQPNKDYYGKDDSSKIYCNRKQPHRNYVKRIEQDEGHDMSGGEMVYNVKYTRGDLERDDLRESINDKQREKPARNRNRHEYKHRNYGQGSNYQQRDNDVCRIYQQGNYENRNKYRQRNTPEQAYNYQSRNNYEQRNNYKQRNNKQYKGKNEQKGVTNSDGSNTVKCESSETEHEDQELHKSVSRSDALVTGDDTLKSFMDNASLDDSKATVHQNTTDIDTTKNSVTGDIVSKETVNFDTVTKDVVNTHAMTKDTGKEEEVTLKGNHRPKLLPHDEKGCHKIREDHNNDFKSSNDRTGNYKNDNSKRGRRRDNKPRNQKNALSWRTNNQTSDMKCSHDSRDVLRSDVSSENDKSSDIRCPGLEKDIPKDKYSCIRSDTNSSSIPPGFEKVGRKDINNTELFSHENDVNLTTETNTFIDVTHVTTVPPGFTPNVRFNSKDSINTLHEKDTFHGMKVPPGFHKIEKKEFRGPGHSSNYKGSVNSSGKSFYGKVCSSSNNNMKIDQPEHSVKSKHTRKQNLNGKPSDDRSSNETNPT